MRRTTPRPRPHVHRPQLLTATRKVLQHYDPSRARRSLTARRIHADGVCSACLAARRTPRASVTVKRRAIATGHLLPMAPPNNGKPRKPSGHPIHPHFPPAPPATTGRTRRTRGSAKANQTDQVQARLCGGRSSHGSVGGIAFASPSPPSRARL